MADLFISYSAVDGKDFALKLADDLVAGPPSFPVWLDKRRLRPGEDWDEQVVEAIRVSKGMILVMTDDSVKPNSVCKDEWVRALRYKKPIIPLRVHRDAELPLRLGSREYVDFSRSQDEGLAKLRKHLTWLDSPEGLLQALKYRLADAQRELPRAEAEKQERIREDIAELERQIAHQEAVIANPDAARERVQQSIDRGLEQVRQPVKPAAGIAQSKFINPPPLVAPTWFQDRHVETGMVASFLKDDALRLMTVVGRGGVGKSAMTCRLLRSIEGGQLPDDGGPFAVDGIVYLSDARSFHRVNVPDLFASLTRLLPEETTRQLDALYKNPKTTTRETIQALTEAFSRGRTVVLLDNFEDETDIESGKIKNAELDEALRALVELPPHGLKVIITTRVVPHDLVLVQPALQRRLDLDSGLGHPFAENILRAMDPDGKVGLRDAPEALLSEARERTLGFPRALEALVGILSADRDTSLQETLKDTKKVLPENVVAALVGEAFSRLDLTAQRVIEALAIYRYPVQAAAVDYLLQPHVPGVDSGPTLGRLVNMQFVRRDAGRYYLHQVDRDYALGRIPEGQPADRQADPPPFTRFALQNRAAQWFAQSRKPRETWKSLDDLAAQLCEFELRCSGDDYDTAALVLLSIDWEYLYLWGHYRLMTELHERLQGKINDPALAEASVGHMGTAYNRMGRYLDAIRFHEEALQIGRDRKVMQSEALWLTELGNDYGENGDQVKSRECYEEALAINRQIGDRDGEATCLGNLGTHYEDIGQTALAMQYYSQALVIYREIESQQGEAGCLANIGNCYGKLGEPQQALQALEQSRKIAQKIGFRLMEAATTGFVGDVQLDFQQLDAAKQSFTRCSEIADDIGNAQFQQAARVGLAVVALVRGEYASASQFATEASKYVYPSNDPEVASVLGVAAVLLGDRAAARHVFTHSVAVVTELLERGSQMQGPLDAKGLALSGLAICGEPERLQEAIEAYRASRALNCDAGTVIRALRLLDLLGKADAEGVLPAVRAVAGAVPGNLVN